MGFEKLINQESVKLILSGFLQRRAYNRTFLFFGSEGVGKFTAALLFAKGINCLNVEESPCGHCRSCNLIEQVKHPDLLVIEKGEGSNIKLEESKRIREFANSTPTEAKSKVVIIREAHLLTPEAGNSLLKILEEIPSYLTPILTTSSIHLLLPTIISRSVKVQFFPLPIEVLKDWLMKNFPLNEGKAHLIASLSQGNINTAKKLVNDGESFNQRKSLINFMIELKKGGYIGVSSILESWSKMSKEELSNNLRILLYLLRDILLVKEGRRELIINADLEREIVEFSEMISTSKLIETMEYLLNSLKIVYEYNVNSALHLDKVAIRLGERLYA